MALDQEDKEWFLQNVELTVIKAVQPVKTLADKHEISLFGATGDNGLNGDLKNVQKEVSSIQKTIYKATGAITAVGMLLHVVWDNFIKKGAP